MLAKADSMNDFERTVIDSARRLVYQASCAANKACVNAHGDPLAGDCCPTSQGVFLDCCPNPQCDQFPACIGNDGKPLLGDCCPTSDGVVLDCCKVDAQCKNHPKCSGLAGNCCPTNDGITLDCCLTGGTSSPTAAPTKKIKPGPQCSGYSACKGLAGNCCPTTDGVYLECCTAAGSGAAPTYTTGTSSCLTKNQPCNSTNACCDNLICFPNNYQKMTNYKCMGCRAQHKTCRDDGDCCGTLKCDAKNRCNYA